MTSEGFGVVTPRHTSPLFEAVEVEAVAHAEREGRRLRRHGHGRLVLCLERGRDRQWMLPEAKGRPSGGKREGGGVGAVLGAVEMGEARKREEAEAMASRSDGRDSTVAESDSSSTGAVASCIADITVTSPFFLSEIHF